MNMQSWVCQIFILDQALAWLKHQNSSPLWHPANLYRSPPVIRFIQAALSPSPLSALETQGLEQLHTSHGIMTALCNPMRHTLWGTHFPDHSSSAIHWFIISRYRFSHLMSLIDVEEVANCRQLVALVTDYLLRFTMNVFHFLSIIAHGLILSDPLSEYTYSLARISDVCLDL